METQVNKNDELDVAVSLKPETFLKTWWIYFNQNSKRWSCKNTRHMSVNGPVAEQFEVIPLIEAQERIMELVKENSDLKAQIENANAGDAAKVQ